MAISADMVRRANPGGKKIGIFLDSRLLFERGFSIGDEVAREGGKSYRGERVRGEIFFLGDFWEEAAVEEEEFVLWRRQKHHLESGAFSFLKIPLHSMLI